MASDTPSMTVEQRGDWTVTEHHFFPCVRAVRHGRFVTVDIDVQPSFTDQIDEFCIEIEDGSERVSAYIPRAIIEEMIRKLDCARRAQERQKIIDEQLNNFTSKDE
jgi:hypothetical protein